VDLHSFRACPVCGADNRSQPVLAASQPPWHLKSCAGCGLVYLENPPAYELLEQEFAWEKTWAEEDARRRHRDPVSYHLSRALLAMLKKAFRRDKLVSWVRGYVPPGPVLDVGCSGGHTLSRLPSAYTAFGIEISKELAALAESRFARRGGHVVQANAITGLSTFEDNFFTGVIMTAYLEHEVDPLAVLGAAARVMRRKARLIVKVPNYASWNRYVRGARWCGFRFPDHVNYFTPALLRRLIEAAGFRVARFTFTDQMPTSDNMWLLGEKP
jgi:SAM-dependent methyltransferase